MPASACEAGGAYGTALRELDLSEGGGGGRPSQECSAARFRIDELTRPSGPSRLAFMNGSQAFLLYASPAES
jgi:hypothetical protein